MSGDLKAFQQRIEAHLGSAGRPSFVARGRRIDVFVPDQMALSAGIPFNDDARHLVTESSVGDSQLPGCGYCVSRMPRSSQRPTININGRRGALQAIPGSNFRTCKALQSESVLL